MKKTITAEEAVKALEALNKNKNDLQALQTVFDFSVQIGAVKTFFVRIPKK